MPMQYFTHEHLCPSKRTLDIIKQIAYTYNVVTMTNGMRTTLFLN